MKNTFINYAAMSKIEETIITDILLATCECFTILQNLLGNAKNKLRKTYVNKCIQKTYN